MNIKAAFLTLSVSRCAGGLFNSVRRLAQEMSREGGTTVEMLSLRDKSTDEDLAEWRPLAPRVFPRIGPASLGYAPRLGRDLRSIDPDLVRVDGLWTYPSMACLHWFRSTRRPYLVAPRGMLDAWALNHSRWKKRVAGVLFEKEHLRSAACIHALAGREADSVRAYGLKNPICILPNGIDLPPPVENSGPPGADHVLQSLARDGKVLLYFGRIHPKKGLVHLLKAWQIARRDHPGDPWVLAIAGWDQGGHEQELQRLAAECGIENSVHFSGPQFGSDKAVCYRHCDAFILPSFSEGLPMVVLEAWSYGKPVLITPECNLTEGFAAQAALRIEPEIDSIAQGLRQLFEMSDHERQAMGQRGLALVKDRFTWSKVAHQMRAVHEWLLGGGPRPDSVLTTEGIPGEG